MFSILPSILMICRIKMKCPICNIFEIEKEDNSCDTDRGVYEDVNFYCEKCGDVTEEVNAEVDKLQLDIYNKRFGDGI